MITPDASDFQKRQNSVGGVSTAARRESGELSGIQAKTVMAWLTAGFLKENLRHDCGVEDLELADHPSVIGCEAKVSGLAAGRILLL
jgi:hypothetical protein